MALTNSLSFDVCLLQKTTGCAGGASPPKPKPCLDKQPRIPLAQSQKAKKSKSQKTPNEPQVSKSHKALKDQNAPKGGEKCQRAPKGGEKCQRAPKGEEKCQRAPEGEETCQRAPRGADCWVVRYITT